MGPTHLRHMLVLWAQLVSMSESRRVGSWHGAYWHPPRVPGVERWPALMWVRVARLALASALVPTSCSAERGVRSPCNRFLSRGRFGSSHQRTFDENHSEIAGQAWTVALAGHFVSWLRFRADGSREDDSGETDGQGCQA